MIEAGNGVFQLESTGRMVNIFLVHAAVPVLVDAGAPKHAEAIVAELRAAGVSPELVLLTHADFDHFGGADAVRRAFDAPVCAPAAERALLTGELDRRWIVRMMIRSVNRGRYPKPPQVDRWVEDGEIVAGLEAVATPGHTPGHAAYRFDTTLIAGDAVITGTTFRPPVPLFCFDNGETRRSIEKLAVLDVDLAVSGHGPPARGAKQKLAALAATW